MSGKGTLYIVATPIGHLDDLTFRAVSTLKQVDIIAAEDTRRTRKLLTHFNIRKPLVSFHDHNAAVMTKKLLENLLSGQSIALVTDGGTPCISDPGYRIVSSAIEYDITVVPVPGASACIAALSVSGLPTDRFVFEGFLPKRPGQREKRWEEISQENKTIVLYEAPHRIKQLLDEMTKWIPNRMVVICRELTKIHEQIIRGTPGDLVNRLDTITLKGEFTILISAVKQVSAGGSYNLDEILAKYTDSHLRTREKAEKIARETGIPFRVIYKKLLKLKSL